MPMIDVKYPKGSLDEATREELGQRLITTLLAAEKAPDNDVMRSISWCFFHETDLVVGGGPNKEAPHFHVLFSVPEGALSERRKAILVEEGTKVIAEFTGIAEGFENRARIWAHIYEVPEGHWGAAGQVFRFMDIVKAVNPEAADKMAAAAAN